MSAWPRGSWTRSCLMSWRCSRGWRRVQRLVWPCRTGGAARKGVGGDDRRDKPPLEGLRRRELAVRRHPLEGSRLAEQAADEEGAARIGNEADADESGDEGRGLGRDAKVAGAGERDA